MSLPQMRIALNVEPYYPKNARPRMWIQLGGPKGQPILSGAQIRALAFCSHLEILRYIVESLEPLPVPELISQTVITISTQRGYCGMCTVNPFCREVLADFLLIRKSGVFAARAHSQGKYTFPGKLFSETHQLRAHNFRREDEAPKTLNLYFRNPSRMYRVDPQCLQVSITHFAFGVRKRVRPLWWVWVFWANGGRFVFVYMRKRRNLVPPTNMLRA